MNLNISEIITTLLIISLFIILIIATANYIIVKKQLKKTEADEKTKKKKLDFALNILIVSILISGLFGYVLINVHTISVQTAAKPIIYLYPEIDKEISVKLGHKDKITVSYPSYTKGWNVFAKTHGDLIDLNTKKSLYSLYYESENVYNFKIEKDGFIVKNEDICEFLEQKLSILGLNDREKEEFIIYWLPILQKYKYYYIRFATIDEINYNMPLEIKPTPDSIIRILMTFKGLNKPIEIQEQKLITPERTGFVAVEWGGTEIK